MSKQVNFTPENEVASIEYPGLVKNINKMTQTLGSIRCISKVFNGDQKRLELRFHPSNPFNKALCGEVNNKSGLLLSVRVRRSKKGKKSSPGHSVRILGYCVKGISFEAMCDFQYLPVSPKDCSESVEKSYILPKLMPKKVTDISIFHSDNVPLFCVPESFARSDLVHTGMFRGDSHLEDGQREVLGVVHKSSYDNRDVVQFSMADPFPMRPDPQIIKRMKVKYVSDHQFEVVKNLFDECPIWTRIALLYESGIKDDKLKCITPSLAYYFSTGPWRTLYVKYGYDPRKDFRSRYYQTFDFRLRFASGVSEFVLNRQNTLKKRQDSLKEIGEYVQDINYPYFDENKLPRSRQVILRYCDIRLPKIQEMLDKIPSPLTGAMCNERTGWLPTGFDGQVRQVVSNSIRDLLLNKCHKEQIHAQIDSMHNTDEQYVEVAEENFENINDSDGSDINEPKVNNLEELF